MTPGMKAVPPKKQQSLLRKNREIINIIILILMVIFNNELFKPRLVWWSSCSVWVWMKKPRTIPGSQHSWNSSWSTGGSQVPPLPFGHTQAESTEGFSPIYFQRKGIQSFKSLYNIPRGK